MASIQSGIRKLIKDMPRLACRRLIDRKFRREGIKWPRAAKDELVDHLLSKAGPTFKWDGDFEGYDLGDIVLSFDDTDIAELDAFVAGIDTHLPMAINKALGQGAKDMFERLRKDWEAYGPAESEHLAGFNERLRERWSEAFGLLRMLLTCSREIGDETIKRYRRSRSKKDAQKRDLLIGLHVRACQVMEEILTLMENGLPDGAMARWRTLHEIAVVATVISDGDEELAVRYVAHDAVSVKEQADDYAKSQVPLGYAPISQRRLKEIERAFDSAIAKYGKSFRGPYGWAAAHFGIAKPEFRHLQNAAGHGGTSSYYKLASFNVHAGPRSLFVRHTDLDGEGRVLSGRCNSGFVDPGNHAAYSLMQVTAALIGRSLNLDRQLEVRTLLEIRDAIPPTLKKAQRKLVRDERELKRIAKLMEFDIDSEPSGYDLTSEGVPVR